MADAFLHRRSIFDKHKDSYSFEDPIKQRRSARSWDNPITRHKRETQLQSWASSFAGRRHYRKLARFNAMHESSLSAGAGESAHAPITEICDVLNRYACSHKLPYKADILSGANGPHIVLHDGSHTLDISYNGSGDLEVYKATDTVGAPSYVFTHWDSLREIAARLLGIMDRHASEGHVGEKLEYEKGHKNSKGEDAPWVIRSHEDNRILASFVKKSDAEAHLERMQRYSKEESTMKNWSVNVLWRSPAGFERTTRVLVCADSKEAAGCEAEKYVHQKFGNVDAVAHDIKEYVEGSSSLRETLHKLRAEKYLKVGESVPASIGESVKKNFRFKDPKSDDDLIAIQDIVYEIDRRNEGQAVAEKIGSELESLMESASRDPRWNEMSDEECARAMYKAAQPILSKITSEQLEEIFRNPGHDHEYFCDVIEYDEEAEEPEYRTDDLYDFSSIRGARRMPLREKLRKVGSPRREEKGGSLESAGITSRDVQAAVRSAWSSSGATDFKLDIVRDHDIVKVYAKGVGGEDSIGIWWYITIPDSGETPVIKQYAFWGETEPRGPERTWAVKDLDELEASFEDEFKALQETIEIGEEN